ncbi:hypothetical protein [Bordetella bronchiseptica]|uniref:hypothetical protein n=1 Tax=Bordetella bronchiseptica TaxID=518 RepID=UPI00126847A1|nr:hypothetical protein [Bordetella bronchiseptica]
MEKPITLTATESTLDLKLGSESVQMTAEEVTELMNALCGMREKMLPQHQTAAPTGLVHGVRVDPRWAVGPDEMHGGVLLRFLHSGFGWVVFQMPPNEAKNLSSGLLFAMDQQPAPSAKN